jgi:sigma-B regulation protein RsbU (phosphoserine phosphatase)
LINFATDSWEVLDAADLQLLTVAGRHIAVALDRARLFGEVEEQHRRLAGELEMAHRVHRSLLPTEFERIPAYEIQAHWKAAREVAGDFYDVFQLPDKRWCIVLADVSGKGAPAALYMAMARATIRSEAMNHEDPAALTEGVNRRLRIESGAEGMFLTAFIGYLDPLTHTVDYVIAGHEAPLLCQSGQVSALPGSGGVLGLLDGFTWNTERMELAPGSTVLVYTDGITDARNSKGDDFGIDRLTHALSGSDGVSLNGVTSAVEDFSGDVEPIDDVTLLMISREAGADLQSHEQQTQSGEQQCPNE